MSPRSSTTSGKTVKPATRTTAGKTPAAKPRATRSAPARPKPRVKKNAGVPPEERTRLIAEAAYFKAAQRGFAKGGELEDWIEAEAEIDALLDSRGAG